MTAKEVLELANEVANTSTDNKAAKALAEALKASDKNLNPKLIKRLVDNANSWMDMELGYDPGSGRIDFLHLSINDCNEVVAPDVPLKRK